MNSSARQVSARREFGCGDLPDNTIGAVRTLEMLRDSLAPEAPEAIYQEVVRFRAIHEFFAESDLLWRNG